MAFPRDVAALARHLEPGVAAIFACMADAPFAKGSWERTVLCALANDARPVGKRARFGAETCDEEDEARFADTHARVARAVLAHEHEARKIGETTVGKLARLLARMLLEDEHDDRALLECALGLGPYRGFGIGSYLRRLAPLVTSPTMFAAYFVRSFGYGVGGDDVAAVVHGSAQGRRLFPKLSAEDMTERLDRWLMKRAPSANPQRAAAQMLVALGMPAKNASALVALAPSRKAPKLGARAPLPDLPPRSVAKAKPPKSPWLRALAGASPQETRASLEARWRDVPKWLGPLEKRLAGARAVGIEHELLELHVPAIGRSLWLPPPTPAVVCRRAIAKLGFPKGHPLLDLVIAFDGLRDSPPGHAGGLLPVTEMKTARDERRRGRSSAGTILREMEREELTGFEDAVVAYEAGTGDLLLVSPRGPVAWARHDSSELEPLGKSLAAFRLGFTFY